MTLRQAIFHWVRRIAVAAFFCGVVAGVVLTILLWNLTWGGVCK